VPFELTWLNDLFGNPEPLACFKTKLTDMNVDIDDIYHCILRYPSNVLGNLTVEVISRPKATRELRILGTEGEMVFSSDDNCVRYMNTSDEDWTRIKLDAGSIEKGYINPEEPYLAELSDFIRAVLREDKTLYPNTLLDDYRVLTALTKLEELCED
jgi:predicted dehydrogenase